MTVAFLPPRVPLTDPRTGLITREWYRLFQGLFEFGPTETMESLMPVDGSGDIVSVLLDRLRDDVATSPAIVATPAADDVAPATALFIPLDDVLPIVSGLRDEIAMLRSEVEDLRKGPAL